MEKQYEYFYHRGFYNNRDIPENSIHAFKKAIEQNAGIELDLHVLKDDTVVVFHDDNLKRMTGINKRIKDCTYNEIKDLKLLKTNEKIPKLEEVLKLVDGKVLLDIELKYDTLVGRLEKQTSKLLDKYKGKFIVKSFSPLSLLWFRIFRPKYTRGQLIHNVRSSKINHTVFNSITKPDFLVYDINSINIRRYKNKPLYLYTIKNMNDLEKYKKVADGFIIENIMNFSK